MNDVRGKQPIRALHYKGRPLYKVEHVDPLACVVSGGVGKRETTRLYKFQLVQPGMLLKVVVALMHDLNGVDKIASDPVGRAVPLNVGQPLVNVDGAWQAIKAKAVPIPELEGKVVGRGRYLEHHGARRRAVHGSRRNQEMVVLLGGKAIDIALCRKCGSSSLRHTQVALKRLAVHPLLQPKEDRPILLCV